MTYREAVSVALRLAAGVRVRVDEHSPDFVVSTRDGEWGVRAWFFANDGHPAGWRHTFNRNEAEEWLNDI